MQPIKPISELWVVGDPQICRGWLSRLSPNSRPARTHVLEDETRSYLLHFSLAGLSQITGVLLIGWYRERMTPYQKTVLALAQESNKDLYVLLCNTHENTQHRKDQEIFTLREEISSTGFSGDETLILTEEALFPTTEMLSRLKEELSQRAPYKQPEFFDIKTKARELIRQSQRKASMLTPIPGDMEQLFQEKIQHQFGGMPYLEASDEWPGCSRCGEAPMVFLMQVIWEDSLYAIFACGDEKHQEPSVAVKYFSSYDAESRIPIAKEATLTFSNLEQVTTPTSFLVAEASQAPNLRDILEGNARDLLPLQVILRAIEADDPTIDLKNLYENLCKEEKISPVSFSFGLDTFGMDIDPEEISETQQPTPLQTGGFSDVDPSFYDTELTPVCSHCDKLMQTLVNLHWVPGIDFSWEYTALQFFICSCSPKEVAHKVIFGEEPYE